MLDDAGFACLDRRADDSTVDVRHEDCDMNTRRFLLAASLICVTLATLLSGPEK